MTPADLLADPHYFLHRIDPAACVATFLPTDPARLKAPSFDGRSDFATGPAVSIGLDALLAEGVPAAPGPDRFIFHVAFCGSTLLARMLEHEGRVLVLKEPNVLVDLADWKRAGADARFAPALRLALACLRRPFAGEVVAVKPSNWVNNLVGDIAAERSVFVTMDAQAYATAVLRGGRDRLTFAARTAAHLAPSVPEGPGWLQSAIAATADPIARTVNLALVALRLQERLFAGREGARLIASDIVAAPGDAAQEASAALALGLDPEAIAAAASARAGINAKRPGHAFSSGERNNEDAEVLRHHGATINAALKWATGALR